MHLLWLLISIAISGLIIGALGRLAIPGRQPMGCMMTIAVGIGGSIIGGIVGRILFGSHAGAAGIVLLEIGGAALLVWLISRSRGVSSY